jgi:hypothetical protein
MLTDLRLSLSSCEALDPEQVGGARDTKRHAHGDDDDVARSRGTFIPKPFAGVLYDRSACPTVTAWMPETSRRREGVY